MGDLERHIDFDLAGYPGTSVSQDFLSKLSKHIYFETILRYVALPNLFVEPSKFAAHKARLETFPAALVTKVEERQADQRSMQSNGSGSGVNTDLRVIFNWLRYNGVKRIVKITVVDYGERCHRDSVIRQALKGFKVEY
jgi:hypothetical protein